MQLLVPRGLRDRVLELGRSGPRGGQLGQNTSRERVMQSFMSCPSLTVSGKKGNRAPLIPWPIIEVPFSRIAIAVIGLWRVGTEGTAASRLSLSSVPGTHKHFHLRR